MKDKIVKLLDDWKVNKHKQELMADELLILCGVMCSLDFQEIENLVRLKHFEDSDYGNNKERCKELLEDSRNVVGYTLKDFENYT